MAEHESAPRLNIQWRAMLILIIIGVTGLLLLAGTPLLAGSSAGETLETPRELDSPKQLPDFSLTGGEGNTVSLSDFQGEPVLLFFGYTHCPDVCPTTLANFRYIKRNLGARGEQMSFIFISVDGSRDTAEITGNYVERFDHDFIGLTGTEDEIHTIGEDYRLDFERANSDSGSGDEYLVDHTAYSYLIDGSGRLRTIYPFTTPIPEIVSDIEQLMDS